MSSPRFFGIELGASDDIKVFHAEIGSQLIVALHRDPESEQWVAHLLAGEPPDIMLEARSKARARALRSLEKKTVKALAPLFSLIVATTHKVKSSLADFWRSSSRGATIH